MAMVDDSVLKVGRGYFYTAPVGTAAPEDLSAVGSEWENMGHTSLEDILASNVEGGERTQLGSLQKASLKTSVSQRTESFTINLLQFDPDSLTLYFGANAAIDQATGYVRVPESPVAEERAWLFLFFDGERVGGIYAPKASFIAAESISISDTESLSTLPLEITPLAEGENTWAYTFIPPHEVVTSAPDWASETSYSVGDNVSLSSGEILQATAAGTSGTTEPTAPASVGGTVEDGTVTWERVS